MNGSVFARLVRGEYNNFECNNSKFLKIFYARTGKLEGLTMWVNKTGP